MGGFFFRTVMYGLFGIKLKHNLLAFVFRFIHNVFRKFDMGRQEDVPPREMNFELFDWNSIILGVLATCLFAECIVLVVRVNSLRNKMEAEAEAIRTDELVKYEKKRNELEMLLKEREIELKSEYEEMLSLAKAAKREQDEKLAEAKTQVQNAVRACEKADAEFARFAKMKEDYRLRFEEYAVKLSRLSKLDTEEIRERAKREIEKKCLEDLALYRAEILEKSKKEVDEDSQRILADTMQRMATQMPQSISATIVRIPDDAMKGRLIGREGRNIRSFEGATATTLIIDESPDSVMVSSFNPVRREVAKIALEALVKDGRINPATIEQAVEEAKQKISQRVYDIGSETVEQIGLARVNPEILSLIGKLSFHLSLNQDTLAHSVEVSKLCGLIASELNCDPSIARRVGLFHDIGKAMTDSDLSHARAGAAQLLRCGESEIVANAVEAHHAEVPSKSIYATILCIADSLSATRPGARMEATEGYIRRIKTLESIALSFDGVVSAYVLQAGRELRVIVSPDAVGDVAAFEIAKKIREKIEETIDNSISVKVTIIREQRFTEVAKPTAKS